MKKKLPLIIVALVIFGAIATFFLMSNRQNTTQPQPLTEQKTEKETAAQSKSLKDLFSLGKNQECSFVDNSGNKGTVFTANNKMRGNFSTKSEEKVIASHIIVDGQSSYIWIDEQNTGYKMSFDKITQNQDKTQQNQIDIDQQMNFDCKNWTINSSVFNLPSGVEFTDFSNIKIPAATTDTNTERQSNTNSAQCAACDTLEEEAKTQCKLALKCN